MRSVYVLRDPMTGVARYVGSTIGPLHERIRTHLSDARRGSKLPVHAWIRRLFAAGLEPVAACLDDGAGASEEWWTTHLLAGGAPLLNGPPGITGRPPIPEGKRRQTMTCRIHPRTMAWLVERAAETGKSLGEVVDEIFA